MRTMRHIRRLGHWCWIWLAAGSTFAQELPSARYIGVSAHEQTEKFPYQRWFVRDKFDRRITFYLSKAVPGAADKLPLVVCIQGSGSQSIFLMHQGRIASGGPEAVVLRDFKRQVRVLVVEKPGVKFLVQPSRPGTAEEASVEYNREFSLSRWTEAVNAALRAALTQPGIDGSRVLVLGHSEGGQIACEVARVNPVVTHVAVMAGGGPTQLFDLIQLARSGHLYDPKATPEERVKTLLNDWRRVLKRPNATDQFFLGHAHLRWTSFLKSSPISAILKTKCKVFIAQGTADTNSLPASAEVLYSELLARGRKCVYARIEGGNHGFMTPDDTKGEGWRKTHGRAITWFLNSTRTSPVR